MSPVDEGVNDVSDIPVRVRFRFLEKLDPHVGNGHRETVVESYSSIWDRNAESWHSRDVLGNGDGCGVESVDHGVGLREKGRGRGGFRFARGEEGEKERREGTNEHEVNDSLVVDVGSEVLVVATCKSKKRCKG